MCSSQFKKLPKREELRKMYKKCKDRSISYQQFKEKENNKIIEYNRLIAIGTM